MVRSRRETLGSVRSLWSIHDLGGQPLALIDSPILGMEGNREFLHTRF